MTRFKFAKLVSKIAWEEFQPINDACALEFDWRITHLAMSKINECSDDQLSHVLNDDKLSLEMAEMYVRAWKAMLDNNWTN